MQIRKDNEGKWLEADYDKFLTQTSATEDKDKLLVRRAYVPLDTDLGEWSEIDKEDAERIRKAKEAAKGSVEYPEEKVNQMIGVFAASINKMDLTDEQSLQFKDLYPE